MVAAVSSPVMATLPESMQEAEASGSSDAAETEPMYLQKLWSKTDDENLTEAERNALLRQYYSQFTKWRSYQARLIMAIANLGGSEYWNSVCEAIREHGLCGDRGSLAKVEKVICLCLGNLEDNASLNQLALLILLLERLDVHHEKCFVFDPCHSSEEADVLKHLGFTVLDNSDEARIQVRQMTLFYMPHGDYALTNNLIGANCDCLDLVAVLGNNLAWVCNPDESDTAAAVNADCTESRAPHVQKVLKVVKETHLRDTLASNVRSRFASLAPKISKAFLNTMCDSLDCTLSTFPPKMPWEDIKGSSETPYMESTLSEASTSAGSDCEITCHIESAL